MIRALFSSPRLDDTLELLDRDRCGSLSHDIGAALQDIGLEVELGEVKRHEERRRLSLGHLVCEEMGDCLCDLIGSDFIVSRPELGQQGLEVDWWKAFLACACA